MGNAGHCTCSGGCLHGLRRSDLQSSEEETRQKGVGSHRGCCICGRDSGGHSDRPDADAALTGWEKLKMVVLTEQIEIPASYERLKAWTANFEEEFVKWSPYHIECNLYNGNYNAGSKIRFREIVMGLDYDVTGTITECEQDENHFRIVFRSDKKTAFITFEGKRTKTGCHFSHTEAFGMTTPVIGAIMNFLIFKVFFRKKANWQLIRDDMILDNRYLYDILTEGKYPERIPLDKLLTGAK